MFSDHKKIRLEGFDYSAGDYFVTVVVNNRISYFGHLDNGKILLSHYGKIVDKVWKEIPVKFKDVVLDEYVIMPDHIHGILSIRTEQVIARNGFNKTSLGIIIRWFKGRTKYEIGKYNKDFEWLRRFNDRIIRNENELFMIQNYIKNNPKVKDGLIDENDFWKLL